MKVVTTSLYQTIDSVNEAYFFKRKTSRAERDAVALWIAGRQGLPGSYADMFAPTPSELKNGARLFTGESIKPSASLRHVAGEEAARALLLLNSKSRVVHDTLDRATAGLLTRISHFQPNRDGFFCCGTCDPALWRHLSAGGLRGAEPWLDIGLRTLQAHRDGKGKYYRFPFYYTALALSEIELPAASAELKYIAPTCERYLKRNSKSDRFTDRRKLLMERILTRI